MALKYALLLALSTIHRPITDGIAADKNRNVAAQKPEVEIIPKGYKFVPLDDDEAKDLIKVKAARPLISARGDDQGDDPDAYRLFESTVVKAPVATPVATEDDDAAAQRRDEVNKRIREAATRQKEADDKAAQDAADEAERIAEEKRVADEKANRDAEAAAAAAAAKKAADEAAEKPLTAAQKKAAAKKAADEAAAKKAADETNEDDVV